MVENITVSTLKNTDLQRLAMDEYSRGKKVEHGTSLMVEDELYAKSD